MPWNGAVEMDVKEFGGLNTLADPTNLPPFMSPDCQDVEFFPGRVAKRPALKSAVISGGASNINYTKTFLLPNGNVRTLFADSSGNLWYEDVTNNPGTGNLIFQGSLTGASYLPNSVTLFGAEFIAQGNGKNGTDIPRRYDGTNFDRISHCGPGAPPQVIDFIPPSATIGTAGGGITVSLVASPNGEVSVNLQQIPQYPRGYQNVYTVLRITTATPHGFTAGQQVTLAGVTGTHPVNGIFTIAGIANATQFLINYSVPVLSAAAAGGGTATVGPPASTVIQRQSNTTTVQTTAAHGFQVGWQVQISGINNVSVGGAASAINQNGVVTVTTTTPHGMVPGATAVIAGMSDATYNGSYTVLSSTALTFTYANSTTTASTSGGTVATTFNGIFTISAIPSTTSFSYSDFGPNATQTNAGGIAQILGSVVGGQHQLSVVFEYQSGYLTKPSPPITFNAGGGNMLNLSQIPIGPPQVVKRIIIATPLQSGEFWADEASPMVINDNTTTTAIINFSDEQLESATDFTYLFNLIVLPPCAGVAEYNSRLLAWGCNNDIQNFLNLAFDGGFSQNGTPFPLGWTPDPTNFTGGGSGTGLSGQAYAITGDGVHSTLGMISQSAVTDYLGQPILTGGTAYTIIARALKNNILFGVNLHIELFSASASYQQGLNIDVGNTVFTNVWGYFSASCTALPNPIPADLVLRVYSVNNSTSQTVFVDEIEIIPTANPVQIGVVLSSYADQQESFDGETGFLQPAEASGQAIRNCFIIRDFLYITKQRSLFVTRDDGQNEPNSWEIDQVSDKVGTESVRGVGLGDEWALIGSESGFWYFTGGALSDDSKLSQEIQPTWDSLNWNAGYLLDVKVDTARKRAYINCPKAGSPINNQVLTLDYVQGWGNPLYSANSVSSMSGGYGRKWCPWNIQAASVARVMRQDGTLQMFFGDGLASASGILYQLDENTLNDYNNLTQIFSYWQSGYFQGDTRLNFRVIQANATGQGILDLTLFKGDQVWPFPIRGWNLSGFALANLERQIMKESLRIAVKFGVDGLNETFELQGLTLFVQPSTFAPLRGVNAVTS